MKSFDEAKQRISRPDLGNLPGRGRFIDLNPSYSAGFEAARALLSENRVTLRIEIIPGQRGTTIMLVGRISTEHLAELRAQIDGVGPNALLDLGEVSLVNLEVVRFLGTSESQGNQLLNCPTYIRKWIDREKVTGPKS